jgi:hypothetical protein
MSCLICNELLHDTITCGLILCVSHINIISPPKVVTQLPKLNKDLSPGPSPAPGWPGTQRQQRPRREEAVAGSRPRAGSRGFATFRVGSLTGERSTVPPIGRSILLLGQIRRLAGLQAMWPDPLARFWCVNRIWR